MRELNSAARAEHATRLTIATTDSATAVAACERGRSRTSNCTHPSTAAAKRTAIRLAIYRGSAVNLLAVINTIGQTPCTDGTWDLYWIAVDPKLHGAGVGSTLMRATEEAIRADQGRMIIIETASKPAYDRTRAFYLKYGCREVARVPDFYSRGDDKVVYALTLP